MPKPKLRRRLRADSPNTGTPMDTYPGASYSEDTNSIHAPKVPTPPKPRNPDKGFLKEAESQAAADDMVLTQPLRYVVSTEDALEKMEALNQKVVESRPDLAPQVARVQQSIQELEQATLGQGGAAAEIAEGEMPAAPAFNAGDRVTVALEEGTYEGLVEAVNPDGTFTIHTDSSMTLQSVPATAMKKSEAQMMTLPASLLKRIQAARMVTDAIAKAFIDGKKARVANTSTDGRTIWLHNNAIARRAADGSVEVTLAGWPTITTRERLNGLIQALGINKRISQRGGEQMLDGKPWDGEWTNVGQAQAPAAPADYMKEEDDPSQQRRLTKERGDEQLPGEGNAEKLAARLKADRRARIGDDIVEEADFDDEGPSPEDYTITPSGQLGGMYSVGQVEGKFLGEFVEWADAAAAIREKMEKEQFWPGVWFISDHGNVSPADISAATKIKAVDEFVESIHDMKGPVHYEDDDSEVKVGDIIEFEYGRQTWPAEDLPEDTVMEAKVVRVESYPSKNILVQPKNKGYRMVINIEDVRSHRSPTVTAAEAAPAPAETAPAAGKQWFVVERKWSDGNDASSDADVIVEAADADEALTKVEAAVREDFKSAPDDEDGDGQSLTFMWFHGGPDDTDEDAGWVESYTLNVEGPYASEAEAKTNTSKFHGTPWTLEAGQALGTGEGRLDMIAGKSMGKKASAKVAARLKAKRIAAAPAVAEKPAADKPKPEATHPAATDFGPQPKVKTGYKPTGVQVVEEGGNPRLFNPETDDVQPAELNMNDSGQLALVSPDGTTAYEEQGNDQLELVYWQTVRSLAPKPAPASAEPAESAKAAEPAKVAEKPVAKKEAVAASAKATARAAREKIKAAKAVKASAFDEIPEIEIGGGFKARRKAGNATEDGKEPEAAEIEVIDADGKVTKTFPDAFGDDTVMIIKFLRQVLDIKEGDDKAAAKKEGGDTDKPAKSDGGESDIKDKPLALPAVKDDGEAKKKKDAELEAAKHMEARLETGRQIATRLMRAGHLVANPEDVDDGLLRGLSLAGAQAAAARKAVDRKVLDLLAQPETELLLIKASLPLLEARRVTVPVSESGLGPLNISAAGVIDVSDQQSVSLGAAFGRGFRR